MNDAEIVRRYCNLMCDVIFLSLSDFIFCINSDFLSDLQVSRQNQTAQVETVIQRIC